MIGMKWGEMMDTVSEAAKQYSNDKNGIYQIMRELNQMSADVESLKISLSGYDYEKSGSWKGKRAEKADDSKNNVLSTYRIYKQEIDRMIQSLNRVTEELDKKIEAEQKKEEV